MLTIRDLSVEIRTGERTVRPITGVDLDLARGETLGIVGETGSGKSMTGLSIMGMLPSGSTITSGSIRFDGEELAGMDPHAYRALRGRRISMVFQDSLTALNPTQRVGDQVAEPLLLHGLARRSEALRRAEEMLALVGIPRPSERMRDYPHQLSGGMRQRVMIAMALIAEPDLLIADEPTTALDVTIQAEILELLGRLKEQLGMAMILVTHDMGVVARHADRVGVMYAGRLVETGPTRSLFRSTRHRYTRALLDSIPSLAQDRGLELFSIPGSPPDPAEMVPGCRFAPRCAAATERCRTERPPLEGDGGHVFACWNPVMGATAVAQRRALPLAHAVPASAEPRLEVVDLVQEHPVSGWAPKGRRRTVKAVSRVSFAVRAGETLGLVGESGCGKSSLGRMLVAMDRPTAGEVRLEGAKVSGVRRRELGARRAKLQMMFQDSGAALDPKMTIGTILREPLAIQGVGTPAERTERAIALLDSVGLGPSILERYPHELSGGQRQRIGLARALALDPDVLVADEPVSALDVSIRSQVLNLMRAQQRERGLSSVVISHDLAVIRYLSDRVGVMYLGKIVEVGATDDVYERPAHPYTAGLLAAVPIADPDAPAPAGAERVRGELPSPLDPPSGCRFRTRCPLATELCATVEPTLEAVGTGHDVACHFPLQPKTAEKVGVQTADADRTETEATA
ncbi:ABC transporter ATP-binding protein [Microbacterium azadirachtae]|uniref:Glutathione import ATP-binding protein GsiA n=1 Tax=Microbacterium azadirachtae TaxID=582680 RepID=A0A0F0LKM4_9MICO|nr:ABC transporter ATP-binding protein [Microbacterium azadirachtae]KJL33224.1 Glutathione import ATP-binding protein GsiA [Microbacterium azadirachtae]